MKDYVDLFKHFQENKKVKHFTREQILDLQLKKFRNLVAHALKNSPFYRNYYANAGITLDNVQEIHPEDCPLTHKKMLMENFDQIVTDPDLNYEKLMKFIGEDHDFRHLYNNKYWVVHTSGSSGIFGLYPFSKKEFQMLKIFYLECVQHFSPLTLCKQVFKRKKLAYFGATHGHFAGVTLCLSIPRIFYDHQFFSVLEPLEKAVNGLNSMQPEILTGYASSISQLAEAQLKGSLHIKPELILCSGDAMHAPNRAMIQKAFGIDPMNLYSCCEAPTIGWQTPEDAESMYVGDHMYHVGLVQQKVCISNLYQYTFPIIRYQMEDTLDFQECDATKPFSKIKLKNVRTLDTLEVINNEGQKVEISSMALVSLHVEGLEQYQFCKKPNNTILVKAKGNGENLKNSIKEQVLNMLHDSDADKVVNIEIEQVDHIPVDPKTGKFKLVKAA